MKIFDNYSDYHLYFKNPIIIQCFIITLFCSINYHDYGEEESVVVIKSSIKKMIIGVKKKNNPCNDELTLTVRGSTLVVRTWRL